MHQNEAFPGNNLVSKRKTLLVQCNKIAYNDHMLQREDNSMRIAICDDVQPHREALKAAIAASNLVNNCIVAEFSNGADLLNAHIENPFSFIFLDIEMNGMDGFEVGHAIRKTNKEVLIIFVTNHNELAIDSFKVEAFDYIVKPVTRDNIQAVLRRALQKYTDIHQMIVCKQNNSMQTLCVKDVYYIEGYRRRIIFRTETKIIHECNGNLDVFEEQLSIYGFLRCHRNVIVNMQHIKSINATDIDLTNNTSVEMSERKKSACLKAFGSYLAEYRVGLD